MIQSVNLLLTRQENSIISYVSRPKTLIFGIFWNVQFYVFSISCLVFCLCRNLHNILHLASQVSKPALSHTVFWGSLKLRISLCFDHSHIQSNLGSRTPRIMNSSVYEQIFRTQSVSDDVLCLELRTCKPSTSWSDKLGVSSHYSCATRRIRGYLKKHCDKK